MREVLTIQSMSVCVDSCTGSLPLDSTADRTAQKPDQSVATVTTVTHDLPHHSPDPEEPAHELTFKEQVHVSILNAIDDPHKLAGVFGGLLPTLESRARARMVDVAFRMASGELWRDIEASTGVKWAECTQWSTVWPSRPVWQAVFELVQRIGDEVRHQERVAEAHRRAVKGVDEPVFWKGEIAGHVRKYSDRLLETLLRAHDPAKYGNGSTSNVTVNSGVQVVYRIEGVRRGLSPEEIDAEEAKLWRRRPDVGDTKAIQAEARGAKVEQSEDTPTDSVSASLSRLTGRKAKA